MPTRGLVITYLTGLVNRFHRVSKDRESRTISRQETDPRALRDRAAGVTIVTANPVFINHLRREEVKARKNNVCVCYIPVLEECHPEGLATPLQVRGPASKGTLAQSQSH